VLKTRAGSTLTILTKASAIIKAFSVLSPFAREGCSRATNVSPDIPVLSTAADTPTFIGLPAGLELLAAHVLVEPKAPDVFTGKTDIVPSGATGESPVGTPEQPSTTGRGFAEDPKCDHDEGAGVGKVTGGDKVFSVLPKDET
jgi:hypothetical protein